MTVSNCEKLIFSADHSSIKDKVQAAKPSTRFWMIPELSQMAHEGKGVRIFHSAYREHEDDIVMALHSSGTTGMFDSYMRTAIFGDADGTNKGLPKLVNLTNGYLQSVDRLLHIPKPTGRDLVLRAAFKTSPSLSTTPFYHIMGLYSIFESIFHGLAFIIHPDGPITEESVLSALCTCRPKQATFAPMVLEDLSRSKAFLSQISNLDAIFYGGAALSPEVGALLNQRTKVVSIIGSTETGVISSLVPANREDWNYFEWNPEYAMKMQPIGNGLYESVITKPDMRGFHGVFHTYPDIIEYRTKDIFSPHPRNPSLWKAESRLDDVIVLRNGEKFNPVNIESAIEKDSLVSRALVVGQGGILPGVLLELCWAEVDGDESDEALIEKIWPTVNAANRLSPQYAQISQSHILFASKGRPFKITMKGSTNRKGTVEEYSGDVDRLLAKSEDISSLQAIDWLSDGQATSRLNQIVSQFLLTKTISNEQNLFSSGMDSLQALRLARMLQAAVQALHKSEPKPEIRAQDIYAHPTIHQLVAHIISLLPGSLGSQKSQPEGSLQDRSVVIDQLIKKYTQNIRPSSTKGVRPLVPRIILLTGSTGTLGNYLLHALSKDPHVSKIICLGRDTGAQRRQKKSLEERGLQLRPDVTVEYLVARVSELNLGMEPEVYRELSDTVDTVIHNAWKVNFAQKIESFEDPHILGVRHLIEFCLQSRNNARMHFVSSIGSVGDWSSKCREPMPEKPVTDPRAPMKQGYSESKFVAENICNIMASQSNLSVAIHRVGQICGPTTYLGCWNPNEWFPSIIQTSKNIGKVPQDLGGIDIDWIPVVSHGNNALFQNDSLIRAAG